MPNEDKRSIDVVVGNQKYTLRGDETEEHLAEVAELVRRRVDHILERCPTLTVQKASILAAFDFASEAIKGRKRSQHYRSAILSKASELLDKVQTEVSSKSSLQ